MKKGFTLIELLAVIIILAIVALISTPIVLDVVNAAKDSAAKSDASMIVSGVNNYCVIAKMKEQLDGTTSICKDGVTTEEVSDMVNLGNAKVNSISFIEKVTALEIESNGRTVTYDGSTYTIDGEVQEPEETPNPEPEEPPIIYTAYSVGDDVTLSDGTSWGVVKDSSTSESEVKLISISNIHVNLTTQTGTAMFVTSGYELAYNTNRSNVWENSALKAYLESTVKQSLEESLNVTISDITIWGVEELTDLGCTVTGNATDGYSAVSCDSTTPWYSDIFENTYSWTKLPYAGSSYYVWFIRGDGTFGEGGVDYNRFRGARPIITIPKSVISE